MAASQSDLTCIMDESRYKKYNTLENLYKCPWFFGELSEENAKEILEEAKQNDENSEVKTIIFLKTGFDDIKQHHFTIVLGCLSQHNPNGQPQFILREKFSSWNYPTFENLVMRKNPFSLEELATVKTATSGVNPETLKLPKMIEDEVKKYQAFIKTSMSSLSILALILEVQLYSTWTWPQDQSYQRLYLKSD